MNFNSFSFIFIFLPLTFISYLYIRHTSYNMLFLTLSGFIFYAWGQPWIVILLFLSCLFDFIIGRKLYKTENPIKRKIFLLCSLGFNLGILFFFKYVGWLSYNVNYFLEILGFTFRLSIFDIPLPPGISFYTFQTLSYILDIYRRKIFPLHKFTDYLGFIAFFPQLIAGPIERIGHLLPQLTHPHKYIDARKIELGIFMISWGLFKKIVVADNVGNLIELCQEKTNITHKLLFISLAFSVQIYADFSGYTDIARGCAKMFGINLMRNFLTPYFSRNPSDFWQRWHISLSTWIRDYVYVSLGGNQQGRWKTFKNLLISMGLAGLWHGAGWFFILWGLYQGILLILYRIFPIDVYLEKIFGKSGKVLSICLMFIFTALGWLLFYAGETPSFLNIFNHPLVSKNSPAEIPFNILGFGLLGYSLPLILSDFFAFKHNREFIDLWLHFSTKVKVIFYLFLFYAIIFFGARSDYGFIYFKF